MLSKGYFKKWCKPWDVASNTDNERSRMMIIIIIMRMTYYVKQ